MKPVNIFTPLTINTLPATFSLNLQEIFWFGFNFLAKKQLIRASQIEKVKKSYFIETVFIKIPNQVFFH